MLKTRDRLDIEDKGQSGETFLAAVEYLDLHKPPFAIFENVDNAPWEKMQEVRKIVSWDVWDTYVTNLLVSSSS